VLREKKKQDMNTGKPCRIFIVPHHCVLSGVLGSVLWALVVAVTEPDHWLEYAPAFTVGSLTSFAGGAYFPSFESWLRKTVRSVNRPVSSPKGPAVAEIQNVRNLDDN